MFAAAAEVLVMDVRCRVYTVFFVPAATSGRSAPASALPAVEQAIMEIRERDFARFARLDVRLAPWAVLSFARPAKQWRESPTISTAAPACRLAPIREEEADSMVRLRAAARVASPLARAAVVPTRMTASAACRGSTWHMA
jgi:hypothetical protein